MSECEVTAGTTVSELLALHQVRETAGLVYLVNGHHATGCQVLDDGDLVAVFYQPQGG